MLAASSAALADEPMQLDAQQLDSVSGGLYSGFAVGTTFGNFALGASITSFELSQAGTVSQTTLTPPTFTTNYLAQAQIAAQVKSSGVGATATATGGGILTTVFLF